ncbi:MAG: hypothetical protein K1X28_10690 [Parachlamydiales bacterium]|nr:hypothetical protein [Parachlamydiales bacterium]
MKPGYRPGRPGTAGKQSRAALAGAKTLTPKKKSTAKKIAKKEGRGGKRKEIDFAEAPSKRMKGAEYEAFSQEGTRRLPKRGGTTR